MTDRKNTGREQAEADLSAEDLDQVVGGRSVPSKGDGHAKDEQFQKTGVGGSGKPGNQQEEALKRGGV